MKIPIRQPDQILAYRSLSQILASGTRQVWSVGPSDSIQSAMRLMADREIGFVVVLDRGTMVGVLSERDCVRWIVSAGKPIEATPVSEIMVRDVITVDLQHTFADCLRLMHERGVRHLPVVTGIGVVAVISVRDLLGEAVTHHRKIIDELELERLTMFVSTA